MIEYPESSHIGEIDIKITRLNSIHSIPSSISSEFSYVCVSTVLKYFWSGRMINTDIIFTHTFVVVDIVKTGFYHVALATVEFAHRECLPSAGIRDVGHHAWLSAFF